MRLPSVLAYSATLLATPVAAQVMVRSDLPLWTDADAEGFWPRSFWSEDSFGCVSKFRLGDFELIWADDEPLEVDLQSPRDIWRIANYGVFHCAYILSRGIEDEMDAAERSTMWAVDLGEENVGGRRLELLAFQIGAVGGSEYVVVAQTEGGGWSQMDVLDLQCPRRRMRDAGSIDVWYTRYCGVETRADLRRMARSAARRPPAAQLVRLTPP